MSIESAKKFVARMKTDADFAKKAIACKNAKEREAFVRAAGFDFTAEELKKERELLSDEELDQVSAAGTGDGYGGGGGGHPDLHCGGLQMV